MYIQFVRVPLLWDKINDQIYQSFGMDGVVTTTTNLVFFTFVMTDFLFDELYEIHMEYTLNFGLKTIKIQ